MKKAVLLTKLDLPFCFRLPNEILFTWDPIYGIAAICPIQHVGQVSFSKTTNFLNSSKLIASVKSQYIGTGPGSYKHIMTNKSKIYGEIATVSTDSGPNGGFSELRAYSEVCIFIVIQKDQNPFSEESKDRAFQVLNHFIDIYRIVTQDPYVYRIDKQLDGYIVDYSLGTVPQNHEEKSAKDILSVIPEIIFPEKIGPKRIMQCRLNNLNDIFPGPILEVPFMEIFSQLIKKDYAVSLHYELIFSAQSELKKRNYHIAILEAETAFEVYVADILLKIRQTLGDSKKIILQEMENPKKLGLLYQRLLRLDKEIEKFRVAKNLPILPPFYNSGIHKKWKDDLYDLRNRVVHEGWRLANFDLAKKGIAVCKNAIKEIEDRVDDLSNPIQINYNVDHLRNTPGRLRF